MLWTLKSKLLKKTMLTGAYLVGLACHTPAFAQTVDTYYDGTNSGGKPGSIIKIEYYNPGDGSVEGETSNRYWTSAEMAAIQRGMDYWWGVLGDNNTPGRTIELKLLRSYTPGAENAYAYGAPDSTDPVKTMLQSVWGDGANTASPNNYDAFMGFEFLNFSTSNNGVYANPGAALEAVMIHELAHALGYTGPSRGVFGDYGRSVNGGDPRLSVYETFIRNAAGDAVVAGDEYETGVPYYFHGAEAMQVYGGRVPLNTQSNQLSHLGIPPLLMTHEAYRNYIFMTEVELAVLKDIGYDINLRNHFGQSYYQNNQFDFSVNDHTLDKTYGVGLHLFADNLNVYYQGAISTTGEASTGVRIDGANNNMTIFSGATVNIAGDESVGVLVSNGRGNVVRHGGQLNVTGANGTGVLFSFGTNVLGDIGAPTLRSNTPSNQYLYPGHTPGYLVDQFDLSGSIHVSDGLAIHIDDTAAVREINILNGAQITGDILTDGVIDDNFRLQRTTITFGHAQSGGVKQSGSDANFSFTYDGDIRTNNPAPTNLSKAMNAEFAGGINSTGTVLNGNVKFYDVTSLALGRATVNGVFYSNSINNQGAFSVSSTGFVNNAGLLSNSGVWNQTGSQLNSSSVNNSGQMNLNSGSRVYLSGNLANSGDFNQTDSELLARTFNNSGDIGLNSGTYFVVLENGNNSGRLDIVDSEYRVDGAFVNTLTGEVDALNSLVRFGADVLNQGLMSFDDSTLTTLGEFTNSGQLHLSNSQSDIGTLLKNSGAITQSAGVSQVVNVENTRTIVLDDTARLSVTGTLVNSGSIRSTDLSFLDITGITTNQLGGVIAAEGGLVLFGNDVNSFGSLNASQMGELRALANAYLEKNSVSTLNTGLFSVEENLNLKGTINATDSLVSVSHGDLNINKDGYYQGVNGGVNVLTGKILLDGRFASNGGIINSAAGIDVHKGGRFSGTPLVQTSLLTVDKGGVIAPGNSIGTMTVDGNVLLNGTLETEITADLLAPQSSDLLKVTNGQIVINDHADYEDRGTFVFKRYPPAPVPTVPPGPVTPPVPFDIATAFKIIETDNDGDLQVIARSKTSDDLVDQRIVLRSDKDLDQLYTAGAKDYYAYIARDQSYLDFASTTNEELIASLLDSIKLIDDGTPEANRYQWLVDTIDLLETDEEVSDAIQQLAGGTQGVTHSLIAQQIHSNNQRFASLMRTDSDLMLDGQALVKSNGLYGSLTGFGTGGKVNSNSTQQGYNYNAGGTQLQVGYAQDGTHLGAYYNFTDASIKSGHRTNVEMHDFGGYMLLTDKIGHFLFNAGGGVAQVDYARNIRFGNTNIQNAIVGAYQAGDNVPVYNANAEYGVNVPFGNITLRPFGGLSYVYVDKALFNEGDDFLAVQGRQTRMESFRSQIGTDINMSVSRSHRTTVNVRTSWMHEFQGNRGGSYESNIVGVSSVPNVTHGIDLGTDFGLLGVTLSHHLIPNRVKIFGGYDLIGNNKHALHTGTGGVEIVW